jgi:hypothetical protein
MGDYLGRDHQEEEGEKERLLRMKRKDVEYICKYEDSIVKPTKHCLKRGGGGYIMKGVNLFKVRCMNV